MSYATVYDEVYETSAIPNHFSFRMLSRRRRFPHYSSRCRPSALYALARFPRPMKLRTWASIVIFVSGYAPLAWILAILDFDFGTGWFAHPTTVGWIIGISLFSIFVLWLTVRDLHGEVVVEVEEVEDRSHELLNYALPYVSSFAVGDVLSDPSNGLAVLAFLTLICAVSTSTQIVLINPLLALCGFGLYGLKVRDGDRSYTRLVLSRTHPQEGEKLKVCALSRALLFGEKAFTNSR